MHDRHIAPAPDGQHTTAPQRRRNVWLQPRVFWFAADLLMPTAIIYVLLWIGARLYVALLVSAAVSATSAVVAHWRGTTKQRFSMPMLLFSLAGFGITLVVGSERFLLAKESVLTAMAGLWFISSLWSARPLTYELTRPLLERRLYRKSRLWEPLWQQEPRFRRIWQVTTIMWSVAMFVDAALRVVLAYTLPVQMVPAMQMALIFATMLAMQVITNMYYIAAGLWRMLHEEPVT